MKLLTKELEQNFPALYSTEEKKPEEVKVIAKFFCPWSSWTWYATEYDPQTQIFFGFVRGHFDELGPFSLDELESIKGPLGWTIERDLYLGEQTLAEVMEKRL